MSRGPASPVRLESLDDSVAIAHHHGARQGTIPMHRPRILILDLADQACPVDGHVPLPELLRTCAPGEAGIHVSHALDRHVRLPSPDCVVLRPSSEMPVDRALSSLRRHWANVPVLGLLCGHRDEDVARAFAGGLDDFSLCPFPRADVIPRIERLLTHAPGRNETSATRPAGPRRFRIDGLVGQAECFAREVDKIALFAKADATVLIGGETGTGKELFARAIHYLSAREGKPFVPVNCGALPDQLFENEMFGHVRGAFTNAFSHQDGLVAEANGGTLFLDEIDTLSPPAQTKLLRFLQTRQYRPLGSPKSLVADVRVMAATNADLRRHVHEHRFREDLYYRLNILSLSIPPLRDRLDDIPALVAHFVRQQADHRTRDPIDVSPDALRKLQLYTWPGNIRELEGIIQRALVLSASRVLLPQHLELPLAAGMPAPRDAASLREAKASAVRDFERQYLTRLLTACNGNITRAARTAGKERRAFQRLLDKHGLDRRVFR
jgi:DNA-binding NtrC family response regulator